MPLHIKVSRIAAFAGLIAGGSLSVLAYRTFDPRIHFTAVVPIPTAAWQAPQLPKGATIEYFGDSWLYPVTKSPSEVSYEDNFVAVSVRGIPGELSSFFDEAAKAESRTGAPLFVSIKKKNPNVEVDIQQLELRDPCGPGLEADSSSPSAFKVVSFRFEMPCGVEALCFDDEQSHQFSTELSASKGITDVMVVLQASPSVLRECTLDFHKAIKLPNGGIISNLQLRAMTWVTAGRRND